MTEWIATVDRQAPSEFTVHLPLVYALWRLQLQLKKIRKNDSSIEADHAVGLARRRCLLHGNRRIMRNRR